MTARSAVPVPADRARARRRRSSRQGRVVPRSSASPCGARRWPRPTRPRRICGLADRLPHHRDPRPERPRGPGLLQRRLGVVVHQPAGGDQVPRDPVGRPACSASAAATAPRARAPADRCRPAARPPVPAAASQRRHPAPAPHPASTPRRARRADCCHSRSCARPAARPTPRRADCCHRHGCGRPGARPAATSRCARRAGRCHSHSCARPGARRAGHRRLAAPQPPHRPTQVAAHVPQCHRRRVAARIRHRRDAHHRCPPPAAPVRCCRAARCRRSQPTAGRTRRCPDARSRPPSVVVRIHCHPRRSSLASAVEFRPRRAVGRRSPATPRGVDRPALTAPAPAPPAVRAPRCRPPPNSPSATPLRPPVRP